MKRPGNIGIDDDTAKSVANDRGSDDDGTEQVTLRFQVAYSSADFEGLTQRLIPPEADRSLRALEGRLTLIPVEANHPEGEPDEPDRAVRTQS